MLSTPRFAAPSAGLSALFQAGICALIFLVIGGCQSGPTAADLGRSTDTAGEIVLYSDGSQMSLISESMLELLGVPGKNADERTMNFYSEERDNANAKVAPNDAITGLLQYFSQEGFDEWSTPGIYDGDAGSTFVVKVNDDVRSMAKPEGPMADPGKKIQYGLFMKAFFEIYNFIEARQNVEGQVHFKKPILSRKLQREIDGSVGLEGSR